MNYDGAEKLVERFVERFSITYKLLAYHAAIPLIITPELLNYLRNKFLGDKVPWVAEVDLLLSELCSEIGYEQYAMDAEVRAYLLTEANRELGYERMQAVAALLIKYVQYLSRTDSPIGKHELQSQRWSAMAYLEEQRGTVIHELAESFRHSLTPIKLNAEQISHTLINESELARLSSITRALAPQLSEAPQLVEYAIEVSKILAAIDSNEPIQINASNHLTKPVQVMNVTLPALEVLIKSTIQQAVEPDELLINNSARNEEQIDVLISHIVDDQPFLEEHLIPRLKSAGLKYVLEFHGRYSQEFTKLPDLIGMLNKSRRVLFLVSPSWVKERWPSYESILRGAPNSDELESKILSVVVMTSKLPEQLAAREHFDLSTHDPKRFSDNIDSLFERLLEDVSSKKNFNIIGVSRQMQQIYETVESIAKSDANVLIVGEPGTGKELVANAIHYNSLRAKKPFVMINCAALPKELIESELFGHTKGAFTGAHADKDGLIEHAEGGSLVLDEIAEMPVELQPKLLRLLQERSYSKLGSEKTYPIDFRLISSISQPVADAIRDGHLRDDLYYRISTIVIEVPPLRERTEDIQPLADHFLKMYARRSKRPVTGISPAAYQRLFAHPWPGNVRELKSVIERAVALASGSRIEPSDLQFTSQEEHVRTPQVIDSAKAYLAERRFAEAERVLTEGLSLAPEDLLIRMELAKIYRTQKRYENAERILLESIRIDPNQPQPRIELAKIYRLQRKYSDSEELLKKSLELTPYEQSPRRELAKVYLEQKRFAEAESTLIESLKLHPSSLPVRMELAKVYLLQDMLAKAANLLRESLAIAPNQLRPRIELAKIFRSQGMYADAENMLKECLKISPRDLNSRIELARAYQEQRRFSEAEKLLTEVLRLSPENRQARTEIARIHQSRGKRGKIFTKLIKEITVAARTGGNPDANARLRKAIADARAENMPIDTIGRAIERGTGKSEGVSYEEITYEGYGPGGVAVIIDAITDNGNRTTAELRHIFSRNGGNLGASGTVRWMFEKKGYIVVPKEAKSEEELFEIITGAGAEDLRDDEDNFEIITSPKDFDAVLEAVKKAGVEPQVAEVEMVPKEYKRLEGPEAKQMLKLMEALEDHDDVQKVSANFSFEESDTTGA